MYRLFLLLFLFTTTTLSAAHFENLVTLTIKVEDPNMYTRIRSVKFDGDDIALDESDMFKPRKVYTTKLIPGRYMLYWSTEKSNPKWGEQAIVEHEKVLVVERGDSTLRIGIKGDAVTLF